MPGEVSLLKYVGLLIHFQTHTCVSFDAFRYEIKTWNVFIWLDRYESHLDGWCHKYCWKHRGGRNPCWWVSMWWRGMFFLACTELRSWRGFFRFVHPVSISLLGSMLLFLNPNPKDIACLCWPLSGESLKSEKPLCCLSWIVWKIISNHRNNVARGTSIIHSWSVQN